MDISDKLRIMAGKLIAEANALEKQAATKKKKWIQKAIKSPGRLHRYFGIPEGHEIPMEKINGAIRRLKKKEKRTKDEQSLLKALQLGKSLKSKSK